VKRVIHVRLSAETEKMLAELRRRPRWTDSKIVREGIRALGVRSLRPPRRRLIGLGKFASGVPDSGSAKAHLRGFGR